MIQIIKNILPLEINNNILMLLLKQPNWKIERDSYDIPNLMINLTTQTGKDNGMILQSFDEKDKINLNTPLNIYAEIIYSIVKQCTNYKFFKPVRFLWNYYNNSSCGTPHVDKDENFYVSFVYNLNTNNGGTNINGEFYKSNAGEAIVFPSNLLHYGVSQTDVKSRFNLNCIVELERFIN